MCLDGFVCIGQLVEMYLYVVVFHVSKQGMSSNAVLLIPVGPGVFVLTQLDHTIVVVLILTMESIVNVSSLHS